VSEKNNRKSLSHCDKFLRKAIRKHFENSNWLPELSFHFKKWSWVNEGKRRPVFVIFEYR
jgi:hypothetical protein